MGQVLCPVLVGETAVGKTELVTRLAREFPLEVISLDSRQIYHGLRIGTAQPTAAEQRLCPHHLVDFLSPQQTYSAARYRQDFKATYRSLCRRGIQPILVGGAGMYLTALREGLFVLPEEAAAKTAAVREELNRLSKREVRELLKAEDPDSFRRIHQNDRYRSQRALEIHRATGRTMSELMRAHTPRPCLDLDFRAVWLTRPVREIESRIADRTGQMLASGWIEETSGLLQEFGPAAPGLQSLGYREIVAHLQGELAEPELAPRIVLATRQFAKRQRTWFRSVQRCGQGSPTDPALVEMVDRVVAEAIRSRG